jgi:hypothetical protein
VTRRLEKIWPNFGKKVAKTVAELKNAKISTSKLNLKSKTSKNFESLKCLQKTML